MHGRHIYFRNFSGFCLYDEHNASFNYVTTQVPQKECCHSIGCKCTEKKSMLQEKEQKNIFTHIIYIRIKTLLLKFQNLTPINLNKHTENTERTEGLCIYLSPLCALYSLCTLCLLTYFFTTFLPFTMSMPLGRALKAAGSAVWVTLRPCKS